MRLSSCQNSSMKQSFRAGLRKASLRMWHLNCNLKDEKTAVMQSSKKKGIKDLVQRVTLTRTDIRKMPLYIAISLLLPLHITTSHYHEAGILGEDVETIIKRSRGMTSVLSFGDLICWWHSLGPQMDLGAPILMPKTLLGLRCALSKVKHPHITDTTNTKITYIQQGKQGKMRELCSNYTQIKRKRSNTKSWEK